MRLVLGWQFGRKPGLLLAMAAASTITAVSFAIFAFRSTTTIGWLAATLEFLRVATTIGFLLVLLGVGSRKADGAAFAGSWAPLVTLAAALLGAHLLLGVRPPGLPGQDMIIPQLGDIVALGVSIFGLVLVEQCYRRTPAAVKWHLRPMLLGIAGLFALDIILYADTLLFRRMDFDLWVARGFAQAMTIPLILTTLRRQRDWSFDLAVSRGMVAGSTALVLTGAYLLGISGIGFLLRQFGGSWGRALESALLFGALLLLAATLLSRTIRAKLRVLVAKHFFSYRFDYREEWLRLTNTLANATQRPWAACIQAIGDPVESPGGALWLREGEGAYRQVERSNFPAIPESVAATDALPLFLARTGWVIDVQHVAEQPTQYEGLSLPPSLANAPDAWLIVPLSTSAAMVGFVVLTRPRVKLGLDWEVTDLLKTAGRQAASYLAYSQAADALLEARKFEAFHRLSTFVVHDLKNLIAQLQLLLSNAERHSDNPDFQQDMLRTIEHVVRRMHTLTLQLRPEASASDRVQPVDVAAVVQRVRSHRGRGSDFRIEFDNAGQAWAHEDLLERVISHLVQNALDASGSEPDVVVRCKAEGDAVLIEVADRGRGMTSDFIRDRLFKPFETTKENGMGIGAFEVQHYVQQIGARLEVESEPGVGTCVRMRLRAVPTGRLELGAAA